MERKDKGFKETVAALNTPFFQYHSNGKIIPQTPRETFEKKTGDCDDHARFAS